jgi:hypothetical protein
LGCDTPARSGAFVDERRVVAGDGGGPTRANAKRSSCPPGQCGCADRQRPSTERFEGQVAANSVKLPPLDAVREAGARTDSHRRNAFADERRAMVGDEGGPLLHPLAVMLVSSIRETRFRRVFKPELAHYGNIVNGGS